MNSITGKNYWAIVAVMVLPAVLLAVLLAVPPLVFAEAKQKTETARENEGEGVKKTALAVLKDLRLDETSQTDKQKEARVIYDEGFSMVGADDLLKIGVWMQNDVRIFFKGHPSDTQFLVRRARMDLRGSLVKMFAYRVMGEFEGDGGTNAANLKEGWLEYNQLPAFKIKVGQFKEPYGLENLYGDLWLDFLERPMGENFIRPEQDLGLMFSGRLFNKHLEYGVGVFNGSGTNVAESNDDKDIALRVAVTPFAGSKNRWTKQLTLGGSFTWGKQSSTLDGTGPTTPMGTRFFAFVNPTAGNDITIDDTRIRYGGDIEWLVGPFSFKGEYALSQAKNLAAGGASRNWNLHGLSAQSTYLVTGEDKSNQSSVQPKKPFNPKKGTWGALELATRFETVRTDQGALDTGFAGGTDDLWAATGGMNWYLNRRIKTSANYIYTKFNDPVANAGGKDHEHGVLLRFQFNL